MTPTCEHPPLSPMGDEGTGSPWQRLGASPGQGSLQRRDPLPISSPSADESRLIRPSWGRGTIPGGNPALAPSLPQLPACVLTARYPTAAGVCRGASGKAPLPACARLPRWLFGFQRSRARRGLMFPAASLATEPSQRDRQHGQAGRGTSCVPPLPSAPSPGTAAGHGVTPGLGSSVSPLDWGWGDPYLGLLGQPPGPLLGSGGCGQSWGNSPNLGGSLSIILLGRLAPGGQAHTAGTPPHLPLPLHREPSPGTALGAWVLGAEPARPCGSRACPSPQAQADVASP